MAPYRFPRWMTVASAAARPADSARRAPGLRLGLTLTLGACLASPLAWAQAPTASTPPDVAPIEPFAQCLQGRTPTTANVPALTLAELQALGAQDVPSLELLDTEPAHDEVILDFKDSLANDEAIALAAKWGLSARLNSVHSDGPNIFVARVAEGAVPYVRDCLQARAPQGVLEAVEENFEYRAMDFEPNDPLYPFQWNFEQVGASRAWKMATGRAVTVAVIDTGVTVADKPERGIKAGRDLQQTGLTPGYDFVDNDAFVYDGHGHGTHVAGTIAQSTNNGYGVAGLAFDARIMPLRVLNDSGFGQVSDIADAVRFAADNGAQVINMSLGGPLPSLVLKRAIDYAHQKGVTIVAAAGNGGKRSPSYPAAYDHVIAVAATQFDRTTTFYSQWGKFVDIAAPGGNTRVDQNDDGRPDGVMQETLKPGKRNEHDFLLYMGTSMASPHVAAVAALLYSHGITHPVRVEEVLKKTADSSMKSTFASGDDFHERYGAGILRADEALTKGLGEQGGLRLAAALLFSLGALGLTRRRDPLAGLSAVEPKVVGFAVLAAGGLFFLPMLVDAQGLFGSFAGFVARPLAEYDTFLWGAASHQNPLMASFVLPMALYALVAGVRPLRLAACGVALGMAAFAFGEALCLSSDVTWIPGMNMLDRAWLASNGLISLAIGYFGLRRS